MVFGALAAVAVCAACGGQSIRRGDGDSGASGEGNAGSGGSNGARDGSGPKGGTTSTGGGASSSGGSGARDKPPPLDGGATGVGAVGAGATSGTANGTGGGTSPGGGGTPARGGSGGTSAAGGSSGSIAVGGSSGCANPTRIPLVPDPTGWIDSSTLCDGIGVQGSWFAFGDQYGEAKCLKVGLHMPSECAFIAQPDPNAAAFPNMNGFMHTTGTADKVLPCPGTLTTAGCPNFDYQNMWGAGIGFDLDADPAELGGVRHTWNALQAIANGIEFTIDQVPVSGLRVEFPMALTDAECDLASPPLPHGSTTDDHTAGAPYWGAQSRGDGMYPNSPVVAGVNQILWGDIESPKVAAFVFDPARLIGVRFHVPASSTSSVAYDFTISNVTVLRSVPLD